MGIDIQGLTPLLQVYDMPQSIRFYRDLLGFQIVETSPSLGAVDQFHWVWLRLGGADLMLNTAYESDTERPAEPDRARSAAHEDTCLYLGCPDVDATYEALQHNIASAKRPVTTTYGMRQMYLSDPDGFMLCFQWPAEKET